MPGKILIAEDDPEARELLLLLLGGGDYHLLEAADGLQALEIVRAERPDLLITDVVMPRMDGYELVRKLREDESTAGTPVIFCSASYHEREVREMARSLGVQSTLSKPFDSKAVRSTVETALALRAGAKEPGGAVPQPREAGPDAGAAQERLSALVAFSRRVFGQTDPEMIVQSTCHGARDILLAQCAQLEITHGEDLRHTCIASGLDQDELDKLLSAQMFQDLLQTLKDGGSVLYPMSIARSTSTRGGGFGKPGEFISMMGVPIASAAQRYGYLCVLNRIGLPGFGDEDLRVARAIAAQAAVAYENACSHRALQGEIERRAGMEREVRRLNQDLEQRVAERTAELEIANRELEAFSYSVAHDLRAPLRLIHAHVQMLREYRGPPDAREPLIHLEQIHRGAQAMSALIDGLLAMSRVSHVEMKREPTALGELVQQAIGRVMQEAGERDIEWRVAPLPTVTADPELMQRVFANLIDNAVKYTRPQTHALIEIGMGTTGQERYVFVRDNGVGFDMRYARKLFGVFQRLHRQDEFEGTGIGLATVSRIIERHGGRIWAESSVGEGAKFGFTLAGL